MYKHNKEAYTAAVNMMEETGKAAVIHPTGTGKSFIGFKLCEDHPESRICWLSPSEYIFRTQKENLAAASGGYLPDNIVFYTYARLMNLGKEELSHIRPNYIVLDEFHRCGAEQWGKGVRRLLDMYGGARVLGLSATNIRYLDNRRDMAQELFGGNIASEITLGEAVACGILNTPKYVLSVYSYRKNLEKYEARVKRTKNPAVRKKAETVLEELRRALENADGLDGIFARHMAERAGKYLVFCADYEHLIEMRGHAEEWFGKIDAAPHIYTVYSDDPHSAVSFEKFKADDDPAHLKLLYCIDALNEGIHVDGVSGVILLRPTASPIVYKQQIGRALSASRRENAVIFDIVMNIESLYSIGVLEEEMAQAATYYRSRGEARAIVNERFKVIEEVGDCVKLFERLNEALGASWEEMYAAAARYRVENGDLDVPKRYVTEEGYALGAWLNTQRRVKKGLTAGRLTQAQIGMLDKLGMRWEYRRDESWEKKFAAAKRYYEEHGDLLAGVSSEVGRWLAQLRNYRKGKIQSGYLTAERIAALDEMGMVWDVPDYLWEQNYHAAVRYRKTHGDLDVPAGYVSEDGVRLGAWIAKLRGLRKGNALGAALKAEQIGRLDELGMNWQGRRGEEWEKAYAAVCRYKKEHGNVNIPVAYVSEEGYRLGRWVRRQNAASLPSDRRKKLQAIGLPCVGDRKGRKKGKNVSGKTEVQEI